MIQEIKQIMIQMMITIKTVIALSIVSFSAWYVEYANDVITTLTSISSFILIIVLTRYHLINSKKIQLETDLKKIEIDSKNSTDTM